MGGASPALTSAAGPAKWAAVVVLSAACGAGLTWSAVRARTPRGIVTPAPSVAPQPAPAPKTSAPAPVQSHTPTQPQPVPTPSPEPAPATTPAPDPAAQAPAPPAAPLPGAPAKAPGLTHRININTATQAELELLPHVGPAIAQRILDYRALNGPFKTIADLDKVKGIGPKTLAKIAPLVTVE
jgi:competence protein ComEA